MLMLRSHHADVVRLYEARLADRDAELARLRTELADALMRERLAEAKVAEKPIVPERKSPTAVDTAIALKAAGDRRLRTYLTDFARKARLDGLDEPTIAQRILTGDPSSDEDGVDA